MGDVANLGAGTVRVSAAEEKGAQAPARPGVRGWAGKDAFRPVVIGNDRGARPHDGLTHPAAGAGAAAPRPSPSTGRPEARPPPLLCCGPAACPALRPLLSVTLSPGSSSGTRPRLCPAALTVGAGGEGTPALHTQSWNAAIGVSQAVSSPRAKATTCCMGISSTAPAPGHAANPGELHQ